MRQPESKKSGNAGMRQPIISSFFSQTTKGAGAGSEPLSSSSSPIDLTISDDEGPPAKKKKMAHEPTPNCSSEPYLQSPHTSASRWRYDPSPSPEKRPVDPEAKMRRELFSKQLLAENNTSVDTAEVVDGHDLPADHTIVEPDSSEAESDNKFRQLQELFARKTEQKKKGKTTQERVSKKQTEVGPSGEPYTALELQVWSFSLVGGRCS
jgi:stalled ribosome alternative rescue factor ArfA